MVEQGQDLSELDSTGSVAELDATGDALSMQNNSFRMMSISAIHILSDQLQRYLRELIEQWDFDQTYANEGLEVTNLLNLSEEVWLTEVLWI
jgi:hypothetical protein